MSFVRKNLAARLVLTFAGVVCIPLIAFSGDFTGVAGASGTTTLEIPGGSMEPTIEAGSSVLVSPLSESAKIKRGEIVILKAPSKVKDVCGSNPTELIDRVVGLPGDHLSSKGNTILVNGKPLQQTWTHTEPLGSPIKSVTVASEHYYMMGDNQANSCDSRYWGTVRRSNIIDKVVRVTSSKPPTTASTPLSACQADGATVSTAIAAFEATNPGVTPTEALITGSADGGPYIQKWPDGASSYAFSIDSKGVLLVAIPAKSKAVVYKGPASCDALK